MQRDPAPFPITLDGNLLAVRNESRIRNLLGLLSKEEVAALLTTLGLVKNETTGLYHRIRCRNNADGVPEIFPSDEAIAL